jgi:hypothetical protein
MTLKARAAAGLVTRRRAARRDWYLTRFAARRIRDARRYRAAGTEVRRLQAPPRACPGLYLIMAGGPEHFRVNGARNSRSADTSYGS